MSDLTPIFRSKKGACATLANAKQFAGATISVRQAAEMVREMGLNVA